MKATYLYGTQETIRFTPSGAVTRGTVNIVGTPPGGIAGVALEDIAASTEGALTISGVFSVEKTTETAFAVGATVYYNATADPQTPGVAETGAATSTVEDAPLGVCIEAATEDATHVKVSLGQAMVPAS